MRARLSAVLVLLALLPVVVVLLWGAFFQPLYANRILIWTALPSALLAAAGCDRLLRGGRGLQFLALALLAAIVACRVIAMQAYLVEWRKADWRGVMLDLAATLPDNATVVLSPGFETFSWTYYEHRLPQLGQPLPKVHLIPVQDGRQADAMAELIELAPTEVTFILSRWFRSDRQVRDPQEFLQRTLGCAQLIEKRDYTAIRLWRFNTGPICAHSD